MDNKFVLVTGAFGGMGEKVVNKLIDSGYSVIALDKTVKESRENVYPIQVDITDEKKRFISFGKNKRNNKFAICDGAFCRHLHLRFLDRDFGRGI